MALPRTESRRHQQQQQQEQQERSKACRPNKRVSKASQTPFLSRTGSFPSAEESNVQAPKVPSQEEGAMSSNFPAPRGRSFGGGLRGRAPHGRRHPLFLSPVRQAEEIAGGVLHFAFRVLTWPVRFTLSCAWTAWRAVVAAVSFPFQALEAYMRERQLFHELGDLTLQLEAAESLVWEMQRDGKQLEARRRHELQRIALLRQQRRGLMDAALTAMQQVSVLRERVESLEAKLAAATRRGASQAARDAARAEGSVRRSSSSFDVKAGMPDHLSFAPAQSSLDQPGSPSCSSREQQEHKQARSRLPPWGGRWEESSGQQPFATEDISDAVRHYKGMLSASWQASALVWVMSAASLSAVTRLSQPLDRESLAGVRFVLWIIVTCSGYNVLRFLVLLQARLDRTPQASISSSGNASISSSSRGWGFEAVPAGRRQPSESAAGGGRPGVGLRLWRWALSPESGLWVIFLSSLTFGAVLAGVLGCAPSLPSTASELLQPLLNRNLTSPPTLPVPKSSLV